MTTPTLSRRMRRVLRLAGLGVWGAALIGAVAFSHFARVNLWACLAIAVGAILANGWVAKLEDDLPGGLNNPDGQRTPVYAIVTGWVIRRVGVVAVLLLLLLLGLSVLGSR